MLREEMALAMFRDWERKDLTTGPTNADACQTRD
jgi:hypothetical protein